MGEPRTPVVRRNRFVLYYVVPTLVFGGVAAGVLLWHVTFGAGFLGLLVFLGSGLLAVVFALLSVLDWFRFWRR